jgi:hypothetical protein
VLNADYRGSRGETKTSAGRYCRGPDKRECSSGQGLSAATVEIPCRGGEMPWVGVVFLENIFSEHIQCL